MECKDNITGIKEVFISNFVKYPKYFFLGDEVVFSGENKIKPIQLLGVSASQSYSSSVWSQTLSVKTPKLTNSENIELYEKNLYRAVLTDYNGYYWVLGAENGINLNSITSNLGGNKSDFSGYDLNFTGKELKKAIKINDISGFIEDAVLFLSSSNVLSSSNKLITDIYE